MLTNVIYESLSYELLLQESSSLKQRKSEVENLLTELKMQNFGKTRWDNKDWDLKTRYGAELMRLNYTISKISLIIKHKRVEADKRFASEELDVRNGNHLLRWSLRIIRSNISIDELDERDKTIYNIAQEKLMNYFGASRYM